MHVYVHNVQYSTGTNTFLLHLLFRFANDSLLVLLPNDWKWNEIFSNSLNNIYLTIHFIREEAKHGRHRTEDGTIDRA